MSTEFDLRDYLCPVPLLMAKQILAQSSKGQMLQFMLNAYACEEDFRLLAQKFACQKWHITPQDSGFVLSVTR